MAPLKQPQRLTDLCTARVADFAASACVQIEILYGSYDRAECRKKTFLLQRYFLENIGHSFEDICSKISCYRSATEMPRIKDTRILMDFMLHEHTKRVPNLGIIHLFFTQQNYSLSLWRVKLRVMKCIQDLDISYAQCSDEIMKAVSDNCRCLRRITFTSDTDELTDHGLLMLRKCKTLIGIQDVAQFKTLANISIRILIKSLPNVESLNCLHLGSVLYIGFVETKLKLRCCIEEKATKEKIEAIARTCPDIKHLRMKNNSDVSNGILTALTENNLHITAVNLSGFTAADLVPFVKEMGTYLISIELLFEIPLIGKSIVIIIGSTCPQLRNFSLRTVGAVEAPHYLRRIPVTDKHNLFSKLESFHLCVDMVDFDCGIPQMCLVNAKNMQEVHLTISNFQSHHEYTGLEDVINMIYAKNELQVLSSLRFECFHVKFSLALAELICTRLVSLADLKILTHMSEDVSSYFKHIEATIQEKNLNLDLHWHNLRS